MKILTLATLILLVSVSVYAGEREKIERENMFLARQEGIQWMLKIFHLICIGLGPGLPKLG